MILLQLVFGKECLNGTSFRKLVFSFQKREKDELYYVLFIF